MRIRLRPRGLERGQHAHHERGDGAVALALGRLVDSLLCDVTPRDPVAMAAAAAVLLATGLAARFVPAWRAGRVDPADTLGLE